ncbi:hypothetical protein ISF_07164 [Cordyceps fumosorosea ARSEF 2679]|uniref:Uncharacterized protein n=1 Tax=Cordyceps fumosorosea (strain ARSEF 2679) TaxID=1081104 RepID=A0A167Q3A1_CORFA|nr:hypothetical protein ISF_07164 [Cordyceps fumosorosea ARSEF 2679]OAA57243.1 hypothetical protein ISF_07164 [Cordyceps fumosorosea ARSEF 2679]
MLATMNKTLALVLSLGALASAQAPMKVYGCSGRSFTGHCETFTCPFNGCCQLPSFFQTSLVSVKSAGSYSFRLFTAAGCKYSCNDNDNGSRKVDSQGWGNIGAAAYACVDGPY